MKGVCKALDGTKVQGSDEVLTANPDCICSNPMAAMLCPYGHMLECHYPQTCTEAECGHYLAQREDEG
jgi:hypothetical protein